MDWQSAMLFGTAGLSIALLVEVSRLRKHLHMSDMEPTRKWKKAIRGSRLEPRELPDKLPSGASKADLAFYRDSAKVVRYLNTLYADSEWAFQDSGILEGPPVDPPTRTIEVWFNRVNTGWIKVSSRHYREELCQVWIEFDLINARMFDGYDVMGIALSLAEVVAETGEQVQDARDQIHAAMIHAMWRLGEGTLGNPELSFRFSGKPADSLLAGWKL